jgi:hypothetical protein
MVDLIVHVVGAFMIGYGCFHVGYKRGYGRGVRVGVKIINDPDEPVIAFHDDERTKSDNDY